MLLDQRTRAFCLDHRFFHHTILALLHISLQLVIHKNAR